MSYRLIIFCLILFLSACVSMPSGDNQQRADGIGGTGIRIADGLGGTGQKLADGIGGTGIIGTITDFGSIWINKAHVHFDSAKITINAELASADDFKLGQVVAVLSEPVKDGYLANRIDIVYEVQGPIASIDVSNQTIVVLGQLVELTENTLFEGIDGSNASFAELKPEQWVQVSGLRQANGVIVASRVDLINSGVEVQLIGKIKNGKLSGQDVSIPEWLEFDAKAPRLLVKGSLYNGVLIANQAGKDSISKTVEQAADLLFQGFLFDDVLDGDIVVGGIDIVLPDDFDFSQTFDMDEPIYIDAELGGDDLFYVDDFLAIPEAGEDYMDFYIDIDEYLDDDIESMMFDTGDDILD